MLGHSHVTTTMRYVHHRQSAEDAARLSAAFQGMAAPGSVPGLRSPSSNNVGCMIPRGAYLADRAAALSGVPQSTVHYWSRQGILIPTISPERVKLWSYADLMGLRTIYWLRQAKTTEGGARVPRSSMPSVRRALRQLAEVDLDLWSEEAGPAVRVDRSGAIHLITEPHLEADHRQRKLPAEDELDLLAPFPVKEGAKGPHLVTPRPHLRIVPGKLGGSPHVVHTRLESQAIGGLARAGLPTAKIYRLYPNVERPAIDDALDLERQLASNLSAAA